MPPDQPLAPPSYLATRLSRARQRAIEVANRPTHPRTAKPQKPSNDPLNPPNALAAAQAVAKPAKSAKAGKADQTRVKEVADDFGGDLGPLSETLSDDDWSERIKTLVRAHSTAGPELMAVVGPHLPAIIKAMIANAQTCGTAGAQDRMRIFRAIGLPLGDTGDRKGGGTMIIIQQRLTRAVSRYEAARRHVGDTQMIAHERDPQFPPGSLGGGHVLPDHVPADQVVESTAELVTDDEKR
jgi:hypothetical protein